MLFLKLPSTKAFFLKFCLSFFVLPCICWPGNPLFLPDYVFSARDIRDDLGGYVAAHEGTDGNGGDGGHGGQQGLEDADPQTQPEDVHQIDAEAETGQFGDDGGRLAVDAAHHEEASAGEAQYGGGAECPAQLNVGSGVQCAGCGLQIERKDGAHGSCHQGNGSNGELAGAAPGKVCADVVCHHQIAQIAAEVPKHVIFVPETLAPHLAAEAVEEGYAGADGEEKQEEALFGCSGLSKPGRYDGNEEVKADERIDEPEVAGQRWEIEQDAAEVLLCGVPTNLSPQHGQGGVENVEDEHRRQNAEEAALVELPRGLLLAHGCQQKCGHNHEQGDRHTRETIIDGYPQAVGLVGQKGGGAGHVGGVGTSVKILTRVHQNDQEAGKGTHVIQKDDSFFFHCIKILFLTIISTNIRRIM